MSHGNCNGCGKKFGVFTKEDECKNCGLTFCGKCVSHKMAIPKRNNEVHNVCVRCQQILLGNIKVKERDPSPPANFTRLQAAKQRHEQNAFSSGGGKPAVRNDPIVKSRLKPQYRTMSTDEMEIAERLEKLKEERKVLESGPNPPPPVQDVEERLARLKGIDSSKVSTTKNVPSSLPPTRHMTQQEETDKLLEEICAEVEIDERHSGDNQPKATATCRVEKSKDQTPSRKEDDESLTDIQALIAKKAVELEMDAQKALSDLQKDEAIMKRLEELKNKKRKEKVHEETNLPSDSQMDNSDEESEQLKSILQQVLEEKKLDEELEADGGFKPPVRKQKSEGKAMQLSRSDESADEDELPWCCICNEDAVIRCIDCDGDLYCKRCFRSRYDA